MTAATASLLRMDLRNLRRDTLLLPLLLMAPLLVALLRFGLPPIAAWLESGHGVDIAPHHPFALGALLVVDVPINVGALLAMLVLDEREDATLRAIGVTPVGLSGYVTYRLTLAAVLGALLPLASLPLTGLVPAGDLARSIPALLPIALLAPLSGCLLLLLAHDRLQGLAVMKVAALVYALPLAGWFADGWWEPLLLLIPTGAALHVLWSGLEGGPVWPGALAGAAWNGVLLLLAARVLGRRLTAS